MKKYAIILVLSLFVLGCVGKKPQNKIVLARINDYEITQEEFAEAFKDSVFGLTDTQDSKREFLGNLINQKLILQEAQKEGLDKEKRFLKSIEKFWEQSLLKLALDKKTKEIARSIFVSDREIEEAYNKIMIEGKADRTYEQMYNQIKWEIQKSKESQAVDEWLEALRKKAHIKINEDLLKADK